jgi:hypothetical protein
MKSKIHNSKSSYGFGKPRPGEKRPPQKEGAQFCARFFGFGFVHYPNWCCVGPARTWYAFRSPAMDGPVCSFKSAAFVHWFAHRFFPDNACNI